MTPWLGTLTVRSDQKGETRWKTRWVKDPAQGLTDFKW